MRKYGFSTYVRILTNQINAVIHSRMSDSLGYYTWPSCVGDDRIDVLLLVSAIFGPPSCVWRW